MFVGNAGIMAGPQGEEVVALTVEPAGETTRLVRRRAAWAGARTRLEDVSPQDAVVCSRARWTSPSYSGASRRAARLRGARAGSANDAAALRPTDFA